MQRDPRSYEQDFILVTAREAYVRQATQYLPLDPTLLLNPQEPEDIWEWGATGSESELSVEKPIGGDSATVWEAMLERL